MDQHAHRELEGKRLVVLGCGYVGSEVARRAKGLGMEVVALTRNPGKAAALRLAGIDAIEADLASDAWHGRIRAGGDFVVNSVSSGGGGVANYRHSYVDGMNSMVEWAKHAPIGTAVYTSSTSVYPQDGGVIVDEQSSTAGVSEMGAVLLEAERVLEASERRACARWFILRLAGIYGPGRHGLLDQLRGGAAELAGSGDHRLNLIHRDDAAAAILAALAAPPPVPSQVFNVADRSPATKREVARWLADRLMIPMPAFSGQAASPRRAEVRDRIVESARIRDVLGWEPAYPGFRHGYEKILSL